MTAKPLRRVYIVQSTSAFYQFDGANVWHNVSVHKHKVRAKAAMSRYLEQRGEYAQRVGERYQIVEFSVDD